MFLLLHASVERSFSKLKLIRHYLPSTMGLGQSRLSYPALVSIEREVADTTNFDVVINDFTSVKSRSARFYSH